MDISEIIITAVSGLAIVAAWFFRGWMAEVNRRLISIDNAISEIRIHQAVTSKSIEDIEKIRERVIIADQKAKAAHSRLDALK